MDIVCWRRCTVTASRAARALTHIASVWCVLCGPAAGDQPFELFDGKSLDNWETMDGRDVTHGWKVVDGMIHLKPEERRAGHIVTRRQFGDFRLDFEWKIAPGGNSGIKYRVRDFGWKTLGCEYQILDDQGRHRHIPRTKKTAALYDMYGPPAGKPVRPAGQFNASTIVARGNSLRHWLNGQLVVEARVGSADWCRRLAASKFCEYPDFGSNRFGKIMLTDHGSEVWYRNLRFRLLPMNAAQTTAAGQ